MRKNVEPILLVCLFALSTHCGGASSPTPSAAPPLSREADTSSFDSVIRLTQSRDVPKLLERREPVVPRNLMGVTTSVTMEVLVDDGGRVVASRYLSGDRRFAPAVSAAAPGWRFEPFEIDGKPARFVVPFTFALAWSERPYAARIRIEVSGSH